MCSKVKGYISLKNPFYESIEGIVLVMGRERRVVVGLAGICMGTSFRLKPYEDITKL